MKAALLSIGVLLCLAGFGRSQNAKGPKEPKEPAEKDKSPLLNRYSFEFNKKRYPQKTPKEALESMIKAIIDGRIDYMMAHLADPEYVDARVEKYMKLAEDEERQGRNTQSAQFEGARLTPVDDKLAQQLKLAPGQGFVMDNIDARTAVARAGLKNRDILIELNGRGVFHRPPGVFFQALARFSPGERVDMVVIRDGKKEAINRVPLADPNPQLRMLAFRRLALETTNLYLEDAARIRELRIFAGDAQWKIDGDRAAGSVKQLGRRQVFLRLHDGRWFLENRQTAVEK